MGFLLTTAKVFAVFSILLFALSIVLVGWMVYLVIRHEVWK